MPRLPRELLLFLSDISAFVILGAFALHLLVFIVLWLWAKRDLRSIASVLFDFTKGIKNQSLLDARVPLSDQIDAFLADVNDVLDTPARAHDRKALLDRMKIIDEKRRYVNSLSFDTVYNMARTMIEAYPLAGVLGTVLAIGASMQSEDAGAAADILARLLERFGQAIWSTAAGLSSAMVLMFINSTLETPFTKLSENRTHVRETVARAKRELSFAQTQDSAGGRA